MAKLSDARHLAKYSPNQPRIPAGNRAAGQWTSEDNAGNDAANPNNTDDPDSTTAQAIPLPLDLPLSPDAIPIPQEIVPPQIYPLIPKNQYPDDPDCVEEWDAAQVFCEDQERQGKFKSGYDGFGSDYYKCLLGQVSERCGGNPTA